LEIYCGFKYDQKQKRWEIDECRRIFARFSSTHTLQHNPVLSPLTCCYIIIVVRFHLNSLALLCTREAEKLFPCSSHAIPTNEMDIRTAKLIGSWSVFRRRRIRDHVNKTPAPIFREAPSPSMILKRAGLPRHSGNGICNRRYHPRSHSGHH
jgi:hypothetical protein